MLIKFQPHESTYVQRLLTAISRWAAALEADEREFQIAVLHGIEGHAHMAEKNLQQAND